MKANLAGVMILSLSLLFCSKLYGTCEFDYNNREIDVVKQFYRLITQDKPPSVLDFRNLYGRYNELEDHAETSYCEKEILHKHMNIDECHKYWDYKLDNMSTAKSAYFVLLRSKGQRLLPRKNERILLDFAYSKEAETRPDTIIWENTEINIYIAHDKIIRTIRFHVGPVDGCEDKYLLNGISINGREINEYLGIKIEGSKTER